MGKWKASYTAGRKYNKEWEKEFKWVTSRDGACHCEVCNVKISSLKKSALLQHQKTMKHVKNCGAVSAGDSAEKTKLKCRRKYKEEWEKEFKWVTNRGSACHCKVCNIKITSLKKNALLQHEKTTKHVKNSGEISAVPKDNHLFFDDSAEKTKLKECEIPVSQLWSGQDKVGFIGLGQMGGPMAVNLIQKGHSLVVYDLSSKATDQLQVEGAEVAKSPAEVASKADRIISMLPNSDHVRTCYTGDDGVFRSVQAGTLILDSSTIDPTVSQEMAGLAIKKGAVFMDAPVSGGVPSAKGGTLTFMVGGEEQEFEAARELLSAMGKNILYCGRVGSGQAINICNNMLLAITMIGVSETMNLGIRLGLDPKVMASTINTATGRCWASDTYNPVPGVMPNVPSSNNYQGGFLTALMVKDLGLAQNAATTTKSPTPLGSLAHQIYRIMSNTYLSERDFSSVYQFLQEQNKKEDN